jgi:hypothetical protein
MNFRLTIVACILVTASLAIAQDEPTTVGAATVSRATASAAPQTGTLTAQNVYIRSRADTGAYACTKLSKPSTVKVIAREGDWLEIAPPTGVFSVISNKYVAPSADGTTGTVTTANVRVRAGTDQVNLQNLEGHHVIQKMLNTGESVEIVGQGLDYYKITPPQGVTYFISAQFVTLDDDAADSLPTTPSRVDGRDRTTGADSRPEPIDVDSDVISQFRQAEAALADEIVKANINRDLNGLLDRYQAIDAPAGSTLEFAVGKRIRYLEAAIALQDDQKEIEQQSLERRQRQAQLDDPVENVPTAPVQRFDGQGILRASGVFVGGSVPKRFLLRHPTSGQIVSYVQSDGRVDLGDFEGKTVGVFGDSAYNADLGMSVITVSHLVLIDDVEVVVIEDEIEVIDTQTDDGIETVEIVEVIGAPYPGEGTVDPDEAFLDDEEMIEIEEVEEFPLPPTGELPGETPETIPVLPQDELVDPEPEIVVEHVVTEEVVVEEEEIEVPEEQRPPQLIEQEEEVPVEDPNAPARPSRPELGVVEEEVIETTEVEEIEVEETETPQTPIRQPLPPQVEEEPEEDDFDWDFDTSEFD